MSQTFKIFFDTEFLEHKKRYGIEAVSIGMVTQNGTELYVVFNDFDEAHSKPWTVEHVLAKLPPPEDRKSSEEIRSIVGEWLTIVSQEAESKEIEFWAKNGSYDAFILCQTLGGMSNFIDFIRLLGFRKVSFRDTNEIRKQTPYCQLTEQPENEKHIAICDARWEKRHFDEMTNFLKYEPTLSDHFSTPAMA